MRDAVQLMEVEKKAEFKSCQHPNKREYEYVKVNGLNDQPIPPDRLYMCPDCACDIWE